MIRHLKYHEIDFEKYHHCIENSAQQNFYVQKENLDFLCPNWELFVLNDYEAVMPVPIKKKFGFKVVAMPLFAQQFGIFSKEDNSLINDEFLRFLHQKFNVFYYAFNAQNQLSAELQTRKNYIAEKQQYVQLRKNYFKGRKSTVKSAQNLVFKELQLNEELISFISKYHKGLEKSSDLNKLIGYIHFLNLNKKLKIFGSFENEKLNTLAVLTDFNNELSLLSLINDERQSGKNGASFLIDRILKENISNKSFNFMGGSIRGIEVFFKSFGSENFEYPVILTSRIGLLKSAFSK